MYIKSVIIHCPLIHFSYSFCPFLRKSYFLLLPLPLPLPRGKGKEEKVGVTLKRKSPLSIYPLIILSFYLSINSYICMYLSISIIVFFIFYLYFSFHIMFCQCLYINIYLSIYISIFLSICQPWLSVTRTIKDIIKILESWK